MDQERLFSVKNRSAARVHYELPEIGVRARVFEPGEVKRHIRYAELEALTYIPGGLQLIKDYLQIEDEEARQELIGDVEPEYNMNEEQVKNLILTGTMDEWLDALDFAPEGVIELIKEYSVSLPLTDTRKMQAFSEKKGINLQNMIQLRQEELREEREQVVQNTSQERRTSAQEKPASEAAPQRRTSGGKYKVVSIKTTE